MPTAHTDHPPAAATAVRGLIVPIVTPLTGGGAIDKTALTAHAKRLVALGIDTIFVLGTTGEFYGLSLEGRREAVLTVLGAVPTGYPVAVGISGDSTTSALANLEACRDERISGYVASTPYLMSYSQAELADHFRALGRAAGSPLILYNFPARYRHRIDIPTVAELLADGTANAIKDTDNDLGYLRELIALRAAQPAFKVFASHCEHLAKAAELGIEGSVQAMGNLLPEVFADLWRLASHKDFAALHAGVDQVWAFQLALERIGSFIAGVKGSMACRGWCAPATAAPTRPADRDQVERLRRLIAETYPALLASAGGRAKGG